MLDSVTRTAAAMASDTRSSGIRAAALVAEPGVAALASRRREISTRAASASAVSTRPRARSASTSAS